MKKKVTYVAAVITLSLLLLSSCRSTYRCPAYSQVEAQQATQNV